MAQVPCQQTTRCSGRHLRFAQALPPISPRDRIERSAGAGSKLQRALQETIAPTRRLGPVQVPLICSIQLSCLAVRLCVCPSQLRGRLRRRQGVRPLVSASLRLRLARPRVGAQLVSRAVMPSHSQWSQFASSELFWLESNQK